MTDERSTGMNAGQDRDSQAPAVVTDAPISEDSEDRFGRTRLADSIEKDLTGGASPIVVAVVGPWGSGKTSVLELVRRRLSSVDVVVIDFNPWLFTGTDQLIQHFFTELVAQLSTHKDQRVRSVADSIERYSEILDPLAGLPGIGEVAKTGRGGMKVLAKVLRNRTKFQGASVREQRLKIEAALAASEKRFVVFVDDIDRLEQDEVRDIVRLVRLVADFPRVNYLLAFDRLKVELALGRNDPAVGRDYLEKIVQVTHPVPLPEPTALQKLAFEALDSAIAASNTRALDQGHWSTVWHKAIRPLLRTPRDIVRYANAVRGAVRSLGEEVNLVDILAMEAYRVLLPDVFDRLQKMTPALTTVGSGFLGSSSRDARREEEFRQAINEAIAAGGDRGGAVKAFLEEVFPATTQFTSNWSYGPDSQREWRAERRVANPEVLAIYFTHTLAPGSIPAAAVDQIFAAFADRAALETYLAALNDDEVTALLDRLEDYEGDYPEDPTGALIVLSNLRPRLPSTPAGAWFFGLPDPELRLQRVVLRLLRKVEPESGRENVLRSALPQISSLSARWRLVFMAGRREGIGNELISPSAQVAFEEELRASIRAAGVEGLRGEPELLRLLHFLKESPDPANQQLIDEVINDENGLVGLLESARADSTAQDGSGRTVIKPRLAWDPLEGLSRTAFGDRVSALPGELAEAHARETVELGKRYASGWRPKDFGDEG